MKLPWEDGRSNSRLLAGEIVLRKTGVRLRGFWQAKLPWGDERLISGLLTGEVDLRRRAFDFGAVQVKLPWGDGRSISGLLAGEATLVRRAFDFGAVGRRSYLGETSVRLCIDWHELLLEASKSGSAEDSKDAGRFASDFSGAAAQLPDGAGRP